MKKRVLAGILMMILVLASAMTVSAAGSNQQGSKEAGATVVSPAEYFETKPSSETVSNPSTDVANKIKDMTSVATFELAIKNGGQALPTDITVQVDAIGDNVKKVVLVVKDGNEWKAIDATVSGNKVTAKFPSVGPVVVYVSTAATSGGQSPSTGVGSSAWMIMVAVAIMAVGAGVVVSQKKTR